MHIQPMIVRIIIHSYMISQNVSMISTGLLWHFLKQTAIFPHDPAIYRICCLLENLCSRCRFLFLQTASIHLCAHLEHVVADKRLHLIMPGFSEALLATIIINITFLKNSCQTTVVELTVV